MLKKVCRFALLFVALDVVFASVIGVCAQSSSSAIAPPTDDVQQWNEVEFSVKIKDDLDAILSGGLRFGRNIAHPTDERFGAGVRYNVASWLTTDASYQRIYMQPFTGRNVRENRITFTATPSIKIGNLSFADRNRVELRRRSTTNTVLYRNRLRVEHPFEIRRRKLTAFVFDEVFYDSRARAWTRNRLAAGIGKQFNEHAAGEIYYLRQWDGFSRPGDLHVIGTQLRVRLR